MTIDNVLDKKITVLEQSQESMNDDNWLKNEIYSAINDSRSTIPHDKVMHKMDVMINKLIADHK